MLRPDLPPHHLPAGGFRNPWANSAAGSPASVLKWVATRWRERRVDPPASAFPRVSPTFALPRAAADELRVTWIGHSTLVVQLGAVTILTDPVWARRVGPLGVFGPRRWVPPGATLDALPPIDLVLLSHNHYDHFDRAAIRRLARRGGAAWATPLGVAPAVRALGGAPIIELDWWHSADHRTATGLACAVTAVPAQHFSGRGVADRNRTLWCGYVVRTPAHTLYFAGDSGLHPEFGAIAEAHGPFDVVLMPIGAYEPRWFMRPVHMSADEAIDAFAAICAVHPDAARRTRFVPMHWGTF
ncbi:MAG: MBL fold metallo-hydrolase, partial [Gemmatimonadaceae bacterium]|nr:MBL fold metallo-hydrolase [Gemmatimonadaceae bacterium]